MGCMSPSAFLLYHVYVTGELLLVGPASIHMGLGPASLSLKFACKIGNSYELHVFFIADWGFPV